VRAVIFPTSARGILRNQGLILTKTAAGAEPRPGDIFPAPDVRPTAKPRTDDFRSATPSTMIVALLHDDPVKAQFPIDTEKANGSTLSVAQNL
jgi:hypothetical protein